ncbi:Bacteriophage CI repressor helix-turn-helix domain-containing protein [uncultured delta proteobacterium]|uniref:Bacteriophage CI repressor helix-turn-helix domain-containing protein n=1 Tax=uncultured delta proteobacterium TaxID=34034 RepID=A0A212K7Z1_9DELT|nr:Bacteriophage CI repressor helix-turn-helix domain-containing protein [uncultured delta proteobacterium]
MRKNEGLAAPSQISREQFEQAMARLADALGITTQSELAEKMGIRQSSVADAKKRGGIPDSWLLKMVCTYHINPLWIVHGAGSKFLVPQKKSPKKYSAEAIIADMPVPILLRALAARLGRPDILIVN